MIASPHLLGRRTRLMGGAISHCRELRVPMMVVVTLGSIVSLGAAGELDPGDLVSMLDHTAIVETMAVACEDSRPDLATSFREAQQRWWLRNARVHQTLATLEQEVGAPRANAFLSYFSSLQQSLSQQIKDQQHIGNTGYAARCDGVLTDLTRGRLDYRPSKAMSGAQPSAK